MKKQTQQQPPPGAKPNISVVDDDGSFLRSVGRLLRSVGYPVRAFGSAKEFLEALPEQGPQCLVLDVQMPGMDGPELHRKLLARGCHFPVVFVTADITSQTLQHIRHNGGKLLLKPFDKKALLLAIQNATQSSVSTLTTCQPSAPGAVNGF